MQEESFTITATVEAYNKYVSRKLLVVGLLAALMLLIAMGSLMIGSIALSPIEVLTAILGISDSATNTVVQNMRLPRVLCAIIAGVSLGASGCVFQANLRNPLASASTLGVSQGAAFGAAVAIVLLGAIFPVSAATKAYEGVALGNPFATAILAFAGAMVSSGVILALSKFRAMTPEAIVLLGVALSALFTGGSALVQYFAEDTQIAAVVFWTFGDLSRVNYPSLALMFVISFAAIIYFAINRWNYNALESGVTTAHGLGIPVKSLRLRSMIVAAAAASSVIAFCGVINFVGLVAPHIMRRYIGSDYRYLLPASALAGAILLLVADIACRVVVAPLVLPIGAMTSIVGAPVFIYLLFRVVSR